MEGPFVTHHHPSHTTLLKQIKPNQTELSQPVLTGLFISHTTVADVLITKDRMCCCVLLLTCGPMKPSENFFMDACIPAGIMRESIGHNIYSNTISTHTPYLLTHHMQDQQRDQMCVCGGMGGGHEFSFSQDDPFVDLKN